MLDIAGYKSKLTDQARIKNMLQIANWSNQFANYLQRTEMLKPSDDKVAALVTADSKSSVTPAGNKSHDKR